MSAADFFKGKKVTVMGLGRLGRGIGDAVYIAEAGAAEVLVTDLKSEAELADSVAHLQQFPNVTFVLGEHRLEDFANRDLILVAPSVPLGSPYLAHAREAGVRLAQSAALFAELSGIPVIGVTGTRGKSTVAHMIHQALEQITGENVILGGNVRGVSNLQLLHDVREGSLAVMELDSWQLQGFGWANMSPHIAVFTNFMEDHLNYYQQGGKSKDEAMELYFNDKAQIFLHQDESGVLITTPEVFERAKAFAAGKHITLGQEIKIVDASIVPSEVELLIPGEHNRLNAALAYEALRALSLTDEEIVPALNSFPGVEGRLQLVKEVDGVKIYNDNNATEPHATIAGLKALGSEGVKNIVLICGGADKGVELTPLMQAIVENTKAVITIPGNGTDRLVHELHVSGERLVVEEAEHLTDAVAVAMATATAGDTILFSPAFASFSQYNNEYERNDEFLTLLSSLKE